MSFNNKLNSALARKATLREAIRRHNQRKRIAESRQIQEGPYYWIPLPDGTWELMSWFVDDYGQDNTDHVRVWKDSASHFMGERWDLDETAIAKLQRIPYCVPRGRVSKGVGIVYINHGGDAPIDEESMVRKVCREFNLLGVLLKNPQKIKPARDNHEVMSGYDRAVLKTLLDSAGVALQR